MKTSSMIWLVFGLAAGNFTYQMFAEVTNWQIAFERSWFQLVAVLMYHYLLKAGFGKENTNE